MKSKMKSIKTNSESADGRTDARSTRTKLALLGIIALFIVLICAQSVLAIVLFDRIGDFFGDYADSDDPHIIDLVIFSVMFFALAYGGFKAVFKDAQGANIALSLSMGLGLAIGLVYGGKFTLKQLLPFSILIAIVGITLLFFPYIKKYIFTKDSWPMKILSFIVALVLAVAIVGAMIYFVCGDDRCEDNALLRRMMGSDSIFGSIREWIDEGIDMLDSESRRTTDARPDADDTPAVQAECSDNVFTEGGEHCDSVRPDGWWFGSVEHQGCGEGERCVDCERCEPQGTGSQVVEYASANWVTALVILGILLLGGGGGLGVYHGLKRRKQIGAWWNDRQKEKKQKNALLMTLEDLKQDEIEMTNSFRALRQAIINEGQTYRPVSAVIDKIINHIKDTIGQEIDFVKAEYNKPDEPAEKRPLKDLMDAMIGYSVSEHDHISGDRGILTNIRNQLKLLEELKEERKEELDLMNSIEHADAAFEKHRDLLGHFKQHDFTEAGIIDNMRTQLMANAKEFEGLGNKCQEMAAVLKDLHNEHIPDIIKGKEISYPAILKHIGAIRNDAIRARALFVEKVKIIRLLESRLQEVQQEITTLHNEELAKSQEFITGAGESLAAGEYDTAIYLASHVLESAKFLEHKEMDKEGKEAIKKMVDDALKIIKQCLPNIFVSLSGKIERDLVQRDYDTLIRLGNNLDRLEVISKNYKAKLNPELERFKEQVTALENMAGKLKEGKPFRDAALKLLTLE
ncbi:hypothetical protein KY362_07050 [Candidatus Woesearchaeota archaeon]|nr:hypothetical protein [Candidatus Woesearchaeota archaeon]